VISPAPEGIAVVIDEENEEVTDPPPCAPEDLGVVQEEPTIVIEEENEKVSDPASSAPGIGAVGSASRDGGLTPAIGEALSSLHDSSVRMIWTLFVALLISLSTSCFFFSRHTFEKVNLSFISISPLHLTEKQDQLTSRLSIAENKLAMGLKVSQHQLIPFSPLTLLRRTLTSDARLTMERFWKECIDIETRSGRSLSTLRIC
jgi:hypothetical protein